MSSGVRGALVELCPDAWWGIATRYDKTPESYLAGLHLRTSMIWTNDLLHASG
ncbi:hypothetical protein ACIHCQ_32405 [Streptomyces sp. NPDC052236]|uniref:hypothetical protein n=1 Tax=Streptomyces sp. NPDC052236 TaxID=3365686 RepID=UPI0037CD8E71